MQRRKFVKLAGATILVAGGGYYLLSDKSNFVRGDKKPVVDDKTGLLPAEREILYLASLAPSGHNTQPWFVKRLAPFHWVVGNDRRKWLPAVDPTQRETMLSIGAFLQNLEYAANNQGYRCRFNLLAKTNQDEDVMEVQLDKERLRSPFDVQKIKNRRTVRSHYLAESIRREDLNFLINGEQAFCHFIPNTSKEHHWLNEQTIEANRLQAARDTAQAELADWIRFSSSDAEKYSDGLTTASMEIGGVSGWVLRNFYNKEKVLSKGFREQSVQKVEEQVAQSGGWLLLTSSDNSVASLLETGRRMQRLFLKVRERSIAIHPMTQILEEPATAAKVNQSLGITSPIQFILRTGYLKNYPEPVSLRRPVESFVRV